MRIGGLASGMDIDSIVSDMMKAQRVPLNKLMQKKQILEWQRDDYRSMNTLLLNFRTNELLNMKMSSPYRAKNVTSTDDSKVVATATGGAGQASYKISEIRQLATSEVRKNAGSITKSDEKFDPSKSLYSQGATFASGPINWKTGAVLTENFKIANETNVVDLSSIKTSNDKDFDVSNIDRNQLSSWSVKVNGKSFQVVTSGIPKDDQVLLSGDGKTLTFSENAKVKADSSLRIDYIGHEKKENVVVSPNSTVKLSQVGISLTIPVGQDETTLTLSKIDKKTNEVVGTDDYALTSTGDIKNKAGQVIGSVNIDTGEIKFNDKADKVEGFSFTLEMKYSHKYTNVSLISQTSTGKQYEKFLFTGADSLNTMASKINDSKVGVSMFYDSYKGEMTLTRTETGRFNESGNDLEVYGDLLTSTLRFNDSGSASVVQGANAEFTINGLKTQRHSNNFTIDGISFTLKKTFMESENSPVTISATNDTNKIYENLKGFIDKYNELISQIQEKTDEKKYKDYQPLTDEEKESLSDKQVEKWEGLAKSGLLRRDSILTNTLSRMRMNFYGTVKNNDISDKFNQLSKIGITTSANYLEGGKLQINEDKLKKAIEEDPQSIEQLFRGENGIIEQLQKTVNNSMDELKQKAGNSNSVNDTFVIGRELEDIGSKEKQLKARLKQVEERYWRQFTAMEQAIQKSNSQSSYLMSYFGGGQ